MTSIGKERVVILTIVTTENACACTGIQRAIETHAEQRMGVGGDQRGRLGERIRCSGRVGVRLVVGVGNGQVGSEGGCKAKGMLNLGC